STALNTSGELPLLAASLPGGGTMTIANGAGVTLSRSGTVFSTPIANSANSVLRLNGYSLRMCGSFTNNAGTANTMGLDATVAGSKLIFSGNTLQTLSFGNQVFGGVTTTPDLEINNSFSGNGGSGGQYVNVSGSVSNMVVNSGAYLQIGNVSLNV